MRTISMFVLALLGIMGCADYNPRYDGNIGNHHPTPAEVIEAGLPECKTGNWWDEVQDYNLVPNDSNDRGRCILGAFYTDLSYQPTLPDGCRAKSLLIHYRDAGSLIAVVERSDDLPDTLYGSEFAPGDDIPSLEFTMRSGQPTLIKYHEYDDQGKLEEKVDNSTDGVEYTDHHFFKIKEMAKRSDTQEDKDGFTSEPDSYSCTVPVEMVLEDPEGLPMPEMDPDAPCNLEVHATSGDGLITFRGTFYFNNDYLSWEKQERNHDHRVVREFRYVFSTGNQTLTYNQDGKVEVQTWDQNTDGVAEVQDDFEYEGDDKNGTVTTYRSFLDSTDPDRRLYRVVTYKKGRLVSKDVYQWGLVGYDRDGYDPNPEEPQLYAGFDENPQWRYEVDFDDQGHQVRQSIYESEVSIIDHQPTEERTWYYDAKGKVTRDHYVVDGASHQALGGNIISNFYEWGGWDHYLEYDGSGRVSRRTINGPVGVSYEWFDYRYHNCD